MKYFILLISLTISFYSYSDTHSDLTSALSKYFNNDIPNYEKGFYDLNGDGLKEAVIYIKDSDWCGSGGCTLFVFQATDVGFLFVSRTTITRKPVSISQNKTSGWHDITVDTKGVGRVVLKYNGKKYPLNPSIQPTATNEQKQNILIE